MKQSNALQILITQTQERIEETILDLANARKNKEMAESFLKTLEGYRNDYSQAINDLMRQGCPVLTLSYYRDFLSSLDKALDQARNTVKEEDKQISLAQSRWQDEKLSLNSYETLVSRKQQAIDLKNRRSEQKQTDEMSARRLVGFSTPGL